jgi:hypothetical protein
MTFRAWQEFRPLFKTFARTVRPWRRIGIPDKPGATYSEGWNDCLVAMKKAEATWFRNMDQSFKTKVVPIRKP